MVTSLNKSLCSNLPLISSTTLKAAVSPDRVSPSLPSTNRVNKTSASLGMARLISNRISMVRNWGAPWLASMLPVRSFLSSLFIWSPASPTRRASGNVFLKISSIWRSIPSTWFWSKWLSINTPPRLKSSTNTNNRAGTRMYWR